MLALRIVKRRKEVFAGQRFYAEFNERLLERLVFLTGHDREKIQEILGSTKLTLGQLEELVLRGFTVDVGTLSRDGVTVPLNSVSYSFAIFSIPFL